MKLSKYLILLLTSISIFGNAQNQYDDLSIEDKIIIKESKLPIFSTSKLGSGANPVVLTTGPEQQCNSAIPVCQNIYTTSTSYSGNGSSQEIPGNSCLGSNELNSVWYTFTSSSAGNIAFNITPNVLGQDYDFALYNLTGTNCSAISSGALTPIRCNFSATGGVTGLSASGTNPSEPASGPNQSTVLATTVGQTYVLIISNYSSSANGYQLDFTPGTASIFDVTPPTLASVSAPCGSNVLTLNTSEQITCASIAGNGSDISISGTGGPYTITGANGVNCGSSTAQIQFTITPALTGGGPWILNAHSGSDGNSFIDNCGNAMPTTTVSFNVAPATPVITGPANVCKGTTFALSSSSAVSYTWTGAAVQAGQQNQQTITVTATTSATMNFQLVVSYGACGTATVTKAVTVTDAPIANFTALPSLTVCAGSPVTFTNTSTYPCSTGGLGLNQCNCGSFLCNTTSNQGTFATYLWTFGDGGTAFYLGGSPASSFSPVHTYTAPGTYNISLNASGLINTCSNTKNLTITVLPATPNLTISPTTTICPAQSSTLTATGGTTYTWTPAASLNTTNGGTVIASPAATTIYTVSTPGCSGNQTATVQVVVGGTPPAIGAISGSTLICPNSTGITYSVTNVAGTNYTWTVPAGATITSAPTNSNAITVNFGASAGTVSVIAVGTCGSATAAINVSLSPALNLTVTPNTSTVCAGSSSSLTASGATNYTWSPAGSLSSAIGTNVVATPTITTIYTIIGSTGTCTGSTTSTVTVGGALTLTVTPNTSSVCPGTTVTLSASGATNYTWSPSATLSSTNGSSVSASPTVNTTYTIIGQAGGCVSTTTANISIIAAPTISVTTSIPSLCAGNTAVLSASGATSYTWSNAATLSSQNGSTVIASPSTTTIYTVQGSSGGCVGTSTISLTVFGSGFPPAVYIVQKNSQCDTTILNWLNVTSVTPTLAQGTLPSGLTVNATHSNGGMSTTPSMFSGGTFPASYSVPIAATTIRNDLGGTFNFCFNQSVINPQIAFASIGQVGLPITINTSVPYQVLWAGIGMTYSSPTSMIGAEGFTIVRFPGIHTCISIDYIGDESYCNLAFGVMDADCQGQPICPGEPLELVGGGASTYTWSNGASTSTIVPNPTVTTTYSVVGVNSSGCSNTAITTVTVNPSPTVTVNSSTICAGQQTATLIANGATSYTWSTGLSASTGSIVTGTPASTQNYTVTGEDINGCINNTVTAITVAPLPSVTVNSSSICIGQQTATLVANGASTYSWTPSVNLSSAVGTTVTGNPAATESYTIIGTDLNGCFNNTTSTITVNSLPTITANNSTICLGQQTATLTANGATTYSWIPGTGLSATTGSVVTGTPSATENYTVVGMDANGCINGTITAITVNPLPTLTATSATICVGQQTATLTASGATTYSWIPGTGLSATTGSVVTGTPSASQNYTVAGIDANGCINGTITAITVNPLPTITVSPDMTVCPLASNTLTASGASSFTWTPNIFLNTNLGANIICTPSITTTYTIDGTSAASCTNSAVMTIAVANTVVVNALAGATPSTTICPLGSAILSSSGATSYTWTPSLTLSSANGASVTASPATSTTYTVIGSTSTCTNSAQVVVTLTVNPTLTVTPNPSVICSGNTSVLTANGASNYTWSPSATLSSANGAVVNANPNTTTVYNITGTSPLGCLGSTTTTVSVIPKPSLNVISSPGVICTNSSSTLSASGATNYTWSPSANLSNVNSNTTVATPPLTTTFTIIGSNGIAPFVCIDTKTVQVTVIPNPTLTPGPDVPICEGQSTLMYATGANTYTWSPTIGVSDINDSTTSVQPPLPGVYIYTVTGTTNNCTGTATVEITVNALPILDAGIDSTINIDETITLFASGNTPVGFINASSGVPFECNYCPTVTVNPQENTCYTIEGISSFGCRNTDVVCITVTKDWDVFIPNAFTPNGDINNEVFAPKGYGIDKIRLAIFDRWGHQLFNEEGQTVGWDGTYKGKICEQGVYIFKLEVTAMSGKKRYKTGHVTLLGKVK